MFPSVIPSSTPLCSGKGQILTDYATVKQLWGHLRDSTTVISSSCGFRALPLIKSLKTFSGVLMKNVFFGGAVTVQEKPWNQSTEHFWPIKFQAWPLKASSLNVLMSDVWRLTIGCLANHVNDISDSGGSDCPFRRALCWLKRRGQAINHIRARVLYFQISKIDSSDQMFQLRFFHPWHFSVNTGPKLLSAYLC